MFEPPFATSLLGDVVSASPQANNHSQACQWLKHFRTTSPPVAKHSYEGKSIFAKTIIYYLSMYPRPFSIANITLPEGRSTCDLSFQWSHFCSVQFCIASGKGLSTNPWPAGGVFSRQLPNDWRGCLLIHTPRPLRDVEGFGHSFGTQGCSKFGKLVSTP